MAGRLPSGFQECEWIKGSGTQYIDTAVANSSIADYTVVVTPDSTGGEVCSCENTYNSSRMRIQYGGGAFGFGIGVYNDQTVYRTEGIKYTVKYDAKNGKIYIDGTQVVSFSYTFSSSNSMYINAMHYNGGVDSPGNGHKFHNVIINGTSGSLRNYVPCYCTTTVTGYQGSTAVSVSSGTVGLYDLVGGRFYVNSGSGTFTKGDDVVAKSLTKINGTSYEIKGGKTKINGTVYSISKGKTLIGGTAKTISFVTTPSNALYWEGDECTAKTGGWSKYSSGTGTLTKYSSYMEVSAYNGVWIHASTINPVSLSGYTKLNAEIDATITNDGCRFGIITVRGSDDYTSVYTFSRYQTITKSTIQVAIPSSGNYYVQVGISGAMGSTTLIRIYKVWLS